MVTLARRRPTGLARMTAVGLRRKTRPKRARTAGGTFPTLGCRGSGTDVSTHRFECPSSVVIERDRVLGGGARARAQPVRPGVFHPYGSER